MRTVTVEVPEGHMVKIVKEESMQPTQKVTGGGKFEFEGETFIPGDVIINPNRGGGSMMILSEIREERPLSFLPAIKVPFGLVAYVPSNDEGDRVFVRLTPEAAPVFFSFFLPGWFPDNPAPLWALPVMMPDLLKSRQLSPSVLRSVVPTAQ